MADGWRAEKSTRTRTRTSNQLLKLKFGIVYRKIKKNKDWKKSHIEQLNNKHKNYISTKII